MDTGNQLLQLYWKDLIQLLAAIVFVVIFKIVLVWGMAKFSHLLQDESESDKTEKKRPPEIPLQFRRYRWTLITILLANGLLQIDPVFVRTSPQTLVHSYSGWLAQYHLANSFASYVADHRVWMTIWAVVIQLAFGGIMLMFHQRWATRVVAGLVSIFSLLTFIFAQNFGEFGTGAPSVLDGAPSASLLMLLVSIVVWLPDQDWKNGRIAQWLRWTLGGYWVLLVILQWMPGDGFWSGRGYHIIDHAIGAGLATSLRNGVLDGFASMAVVWTIIIGLLGLALAVWTFRIRIQSRRSELGWLIGNAVAGIFIWWIGSGVDIGSLYVYPLGTGAVVIGMSYLMIATRRESI